MAGKNADSAGKRSQLVGGNRLELLLFSIPNQQTFGINVFKVREALPCPPLNQLPNAHPCICGIARIRDQVISIFDLAACLGMPKTENFDDYFVIITEFNRTTQGFLVKNINRIVNISWEDIQTPPDSLGKDNFLTSITKIDDKIVNILDVEKILANILGSEYSVSESLIEECADSNQEEEPFVLVVDDSSVARKQIISTLTQIGLQSTAVENGKKALDFLRAIKNPTDWPKVVICDIEMPVMDGYSFTTEVRKDSTLSHLKIVLHSSMSGKFNEALSKKVGADKFISKFDPDDLAKEVHDLVYEDVQS